jgi:hypothetical protein
MASISLTFEPAQNPEQFNKWGFPGRHVVNWLLLNLKVVGHIQLKGYLQNQGDALISTCYSILRETGPQQNKGKFPTHREERECYLL